MIYSQRKAEYREVGTFYGMALRWSGCLFHLNSSCFYFLTLTVILIAILRGTTNAKSFMELCEILAVISNFHYHRCLIHVTQHSRIQVMYMMRDLFSKNTVRRVNTLSNPSDHKFTLISNWNFSSRRKSPTMHGVREWVHIPPFLI